MADNIELNAGAGGAQLKTDELADLTHVQYTKLMDGTANSAAVIPGDATNGLDVDVTRVSGNVTVVGAAADGAAASGNPVTVAGFDGTNAQSISTTTGGHVHIHDGGNAITVDGTVAVTGVATEAKQDTGNASLATLAGAVAGSEVQVDVLTMPTVTVDSELTTADLDTGAGTDTRAVVGLVGSASGGGQLIPGSATDGLLVNLGANNDVTVTGSVTANAGTNLNTSALALESGGNLAAAAASLAILDDAHTADFDTGAGTDTTPAFGIAVPASGGAAVVPGDATNGLKVQVTSAPSTAVTNAGTFAVQESGGALTALQIMDDWDNAASDGASVSGDTAHDAADAGEPVKVGAKATTALSGVTLVANADRTDLYAGVDGVLITRPYCGLEDIVSGVAAITDGSSTSVIAAQGAGVKVYITSVVISNSSSTSVTVDLRDGAAGTVKATYPAPASTSSMGGASHALPVPLAFSANTAVCADPSAAASTVSVTLVGFKSKV